ncbi:hypothetical protein V493_01614 [Pseudogymnoascus sp. VKM F-4281 (FW-2241)]|nr:hypothetical protein V493_01614 [Pseudogymnoascus sp. VKM F-4281 (FW-2241)]
MLLKGAALVSGLLAGSSYAGSVPSNVKSFYDGLRSKKSCSNPLKSGFYALDGGAKGRAYCGDHIDDFNVVYIQGKNGQLADMDIDCDGIINSPYSDGRCEASQDTQPQSSYIDLIKGYNVGIKDVDSYIHSYVVLGNYADEGTSGYTTFHPTDYGIEPLSIVAVVCNNKLFYGVWADQNGDDGPPMIGETSLAIATLCYGKENIDGDHGHSELDVLYIAFPGSDAVPGAKGANWKASTAKAFQDSLTTQGNKLIQRIGGGGGGGPSPTTTGGGGPAPTCDWAGHCEGSSCKTNDDCSDPWACVNGKCGMDPNGSTPCDWEGHCEGASCGSNDDCSDPWACISGKCAVDPEA